MPSRQARFSDACPGRGLALPRETAPRERRAGTGGGPVPPPQPRTTGCTSWCAARAP